MLDFARFTHLTFDCYGTLIDWETGILDALVPLIRRYGAEADEVRLLRLYAQLEAELEAGEYRPYREVLKGVAAGLGRQLGFEPTPEEAEAFADSVGDWPPFADTVDALQRLQRRYRLVILSNVDDDLFARTHRLLQVRFDAVITAQQLRSYKPARRNFEAALERLGVGPGEVLHVAQSPYHDHVPAKALGLSTVWVNRPSRLAGTGVAPAASVQPDLEVPDLATLVRAMGL